MNIMLTKKYRLLLLAAGCACLCFISCENKPEKPESVQLHNNLESALEELPANNEMYIVDYAHISKNTLHHGTFSLIDGKTGATWTLSLDESQRTYDIKMSKEQFMNLWDQTRSISDFKDNKMEEHQQMNLITHHVIGLVSQTEKTRHVNTYMIPKVSCSEEFKTWLTMIRYTGE